MKKPALRSLVLVAACALASCGGLTKSPADGLTFAAPHGWRSSPGIMGMAQFWVGPNDQMLMLFKTPRDWTESEAFTSADMKDVHIELQRSISICDGSRQATYIKAVATSKRTNDDSNDEMMIAKAPDSTYVALYAYPIGVVPQAEAEAALHELCPANKS